MITTLLMTCLAATEVNSVDAAAQPAAVEQSGWSVQLTLASPSVLGVSFALDAPDGSLGFVGQSRFLPGLTVERRFGARWVGVSSLSFGAGVSPSLNALSGGGLLGARWYPARAFEGFFVGPELMVSVNAAGSPVGGVGLFQNYAVGAGARVGWTQRFGEHFVASASAALNGHVSWRTPTAATLAPLTWANVGLDVMLSAGLVF